MLPRHSLLLDSAKAYLQFLAEEERLLEVVFLLAFLLEDWVLWVLCLLLLLEVRDSVVFLELRLSMVK